MGLIALTLRLPLAMPSDWQPDERPRNTLVRVVASASPVMHFAHAHAGVSGTFLHFQVLPWGCLARTPQSTFDAVIQMSSVRPRTWYVMCVSPTWSRSLGESLPSSLHASILPWGSVGLGGWYAGQKGCSHLLRGVVEELLGLLLAEWVPDSLSLSFEKRHEEK